MLQLIFIGVVVALFYYYAIKPMTYWKDRDVIQTKPIWLFGDLWKQIFAMENVADICQKIYNLAPDERYIGMYQFNSPALMIKDPALIKQVTVKDFEHFMNHRAFIPEGADPLWSKNLLSLRDNRWKEMRSILSPSFTSSKMKMMYNLMVECSENLVKYFSKQGDFVDITMKDVATRFANDIIASTAFGVRTDSLERQNNEFYLMGREITNFSTIWKTLKMFGFMVMPNMFKFFKINLFDGISRHFFIDLISNTIKTREEKNIKRPDMINLLLEARKGIDDKEHAKNEEDAGFDNDKANSLAKHVGQITDEDITAHALIFFFGGFDSVSGLMCFMAYELAIHPDIQTKLRKEVDDGFKQCNGKLTYEVLMKMKYLDMVMSESLRKWPNFPQMDRECTKRYVIEPKNPNEKPLVLEEGTILLLPIMAIHRDPKNFPNPDSFDPERFSDENKDNIDPYSYLPFGLGPRNCIGSRFALLETKILFAYLLYNFEIVPTSKTVIPVQLSKKNFNLHPADGMQLGLKRLKK